MHTLAELRAPKLNKILELVLFAMLGVVAFVSKLLMAALPNIHILAVLFTAYTLVFRAKALISIYVFAFLELFEIGSFVWWVPHLYVWTVLWGLVMLLPKRTPIKIGAALCIAVCGLHGFLYGTLWLPSQVLILGFNLEQSLTWLAFGLPYDAIHGISNLLLGSLVIPLATALRRVL